MAESETTPGFAERPNGGVFYGWWLVATGVIILVLAGDTLMKVTRRCCTLGS